MYAMQAITSTVFHLMVFPHKAKIMTVDQLTYHDLQGLTAPTNIIPTINTIDPQGVDVYVTSKFIHLYFLCIVTRCLFRDVFVMYLSHFMPQCSYHEVSIM